MFKKSLNLDPPYRTLITRLGGSIWPDPALSTGLRYLCCGCCSGYPRPLVPNKTNLPVSPAEGRPAPPGPRRPRGGARAGGGGPGAGLGDAVPFLPQAEVSFSHNISNNAMSL